MFPILCKYHVEKLQLSITIRCIIIQTDNVSKNNRVRERYRQIILEMCK